MGSGIKKIDGGLVKEVIKFPFSDNRIAVWGNRSGGIWNAEDVCSSVQERRVAWKLVGGRC